MHSRRPVTVAFTVALLLLPLAAGCDKSSSAEETGATPPERSGPPRGPQKGRPDFAAMDSNGDGKLVASEVPDKQWSRLVEADSDGDGALSKAEFDAHRPPRPKR